MQRGIWGIARDAVTPGTQVENALGYNRRNLLNGVAAVALQRGRWAKNRARRDGRGGAGLSREDERTLRALKTPAQIQKFVDGIEYQYADTAWSPARVLRERKGHCLEGALLAAAALRANGRPPLVMDLEAVHDDDHVVAIYRTLRELALSYFEHYYNLRGERTLRAYSRPVNLARLDGLHWMTAEDDVWFVADALIAARHYALFPHKVARALPRLDRRSFEAGMHGWVRH